MDKDLVFALICVASHLAVMCAVAAHLLKQMRLERLEQEADGFDEGGGGGGTAPAAPRPGPGGGGGLPLPHAVQSGRRIRGHGGLRERRRERRRRRARPRPDRRPSRR